MNINLETGGPAFPFEMLLDNGDNTKTQHIFPGMTLRDYFAIRASEEDIRRHLFTGPIIDVVVERIGGRKEIDKQPKVQTREQARYAFADAMLKVRKEK